MWIRIADWIVKVTVAWTFGMLFTALALITLWGIRGEMFPNERLIIIVFPLTVIFMRFFYRAVVRIRKYRPLPEYH